MLVDVVFSPRFLDREMLPGKNAVVIDILRATSTMVTALANGALRIRPCLTITDAFLCQSTSQEDSPLLCGERKAQLIPGFDLGNSPLEYTAARIGGRSLIATTSNGTKTILAATAAKEVIIACLLNSSAVADHLVAAGRDTVFICSGTNGEVSYDDLLGAGCLIDKLARGSDDLTLSDGATAMRDLYRLHRGDLAAGLLSARHARRLLDIGLWADIQYCAQEDIFSIVPVYQDGIIKKLPKRIA